MALAQRPPRDGSHVNANSDAATFIAGYRRRLVGAGYEHPIRRLEPWAARACERRAPARQGAWRAGRLVQRRRQNERSLLTADGRRASLLCNKKECSFFL
jgi:hypothetical protein